MKGEDIMHSPQPQRLFRPISCNIGSRANSTPRDPLARLLKQLLALAGDEARVMATQSRPWASATFIGAQHLLTLEMDGHAAEAFAKALPEAEFAIPGHIVADAVVDSQEMRLDDDRQTSVLQLTFLTIEDW